MLKTSSCIWKQIKFTSPVFPLSTNLDQYRFQRIVRKQDLTYNYYQQNLSGRVAIY